MTTPTPTHDRPASPPLTYYDIAIRNGDRRWMPMGRIKARDTASAIAKAATIAHHYAPFDTIRAKPTL